MRTILVADDSPLARRVLAMRLEVHGYTVVEHACVASALASVPASLACAVLDLDLGDGDGVEVARWLRASHPVLPLAFFTTGGDAELLSAARRLGPVFEKPHALDSVVAWVRAHGEPAPGS